MIGREIGPYRILEKIGQGGMGVVYKGIHTRLDQQVAIKVLSPEYAQNPSMRERFIAEAKLQARLTHAHVVNIFNYLEDADNLFLVMEYIDGPTLEQRLATGGPLPEREVVSTCQDVLTALSFMHSQGAIHRDIKPANIMFTAAGLVKVTDFGIAKVAGKEGLTRAGLRIGTLWYMSPERIQGKPATITSDFYALGVTLYQMATGKFPFKSDSEYSIMRGHIEEPPVPPWEVNSHTSRELGHIILKALEKKPEQRYQSAREFADALTSIAPQSHNPEVATQALVHPQSPMGRTRRLGPLQRAVLGAGLGLTLAILAYFVWFYSPGNSVLPFFRDLATQVVGRPTSTSAIDPVVSPTQSVPPNRRLEEARPPSAPAVGTGSAEAELKNIRGAHPRTAIFTPPRGENVSAIQQAVALIDHFLPNGGDFRLTVWSDKGREAVYTAGERIVVNVVADTDAYLRVDYYLPGGQVYHFPSNSQDSQFVRAGSLFSFGEFDASVSFPPMAQSGEGLIAVIASQRRLEQGTGRHPTVEPAATYLDRLAKIFSEYRAIEKLAGARIFVLTRQQEGSPAVQERIRVPLHPEGPSAVSPIVPQPPAPSLESQEPQQGGSPTGKDTKKKQPSRTDFKPPVAERGSRNPEASKNSEGSRNPEGSRSSEGSRSPGGWYIKK